VTQDGIVTDFKEKQQEKAPGSIRSSFEPNSKVNEDRTEHPEKQFFPRTSTDEGIQIANNDGDLENAPYPIWMSCEPDSNAIICGNTPETSSA
jgi:hypothetical protein